MSGDGQLLLGDAAVGLDREGLDRVDSQAKTLSGERDRRQAVVSTSEGREEEEEEERQRGIPVRIVCGAKGVLFVVDLPEYTKPLCSMLIVVSTQRIRPMMRSSVALLVTATSG